MRRLVLGRTQEKRSNRMFDLRTKVVFPILSLVVSSTIVLSIAELSLRVLNIGYGNAPEESHEIFHHVHPANYRFLSHTQTGEYGGHEVYYNPERLVANPEQHPNKDKLTTCRVAFLGDSFTEATQVAYEDSFVGILARGSACTIKNYGMSSYSPIFYLLQWREIVREFKPTLVIVQLYSNDISGDKDYMNVAVKNQDDEVLAIPGPGGGWIISQLRKSFLIRFIRKAQLQLLWTYKNRGTEHDVVGGIVEENPNISKLSAGFIKKLAHEVQASGAQFAITVVPSKFRIYKNNTDHQTLQFSDKWRLFAQENSIVFLDLTKPFEKEVRNGFRLFFDNDIHFNENGHMVVASELTNAYPRLFGVYRHRLASDTDDNVRSAHP